MHAAQFKHLLERVSYPGMSFAMEAADPDAVGFRILTCLVSTDSHTGKREKFAMPHLVYNHEIQMFDELGALEWILSAVKAHMNHEIEEFFKCDGEIVFNPHRKEVAGNGVR